VSSLLVKKISESVLPRFFSRVLHKINSFKKYTMNATVELTIEKAISSRLESVDWDHLDFGAIPTDHMCTCEYKNNGWLNPKIVPFAPLVMSPLAHCLHYGQTIFEGLKAFRMEDGNISIFRPQANYRRMVASAERMCMPVVSEDIYLKGLHTLITLDQKWVPLQADAALYIRPFIIATEEKLGVKISDEYLFMIIAAPSGKYFSAPLRLKVETEYVRTSEGGVGYAKCGGNYAASYFPMKKAREEGFDQVIWTDCKNHEYIEESGVMNIMLIVDDLLLTPALSTAILEGITRDSILTLAKDYGLKTAERKISVEELQNWLAAGKVREAFGAGTAAVVSPIREIAVGNKRYPVPVGNESFMFWAKKTLEEIRRGAREDKYGWNYIVKV
jgi:branched-chain amino acid aminotransferase